MRGTRGVLIRGLAAGGAGATVLALWFLLVELAASAPFRIPAMIGRTLFGMEGLEGAPGFVALFTVFHFTFFLVVDVVQGHPFFTPSALGSAIFPFGIAAAALLREAEGQPQILLGGILFCVAFEAFFLGVIAVAAEFLLGPLGWWSIAVGNLVGAITMVGYLWRRHPELARSLGTETLERPA